MIFKKTRRAYAVNCNFGQTRTIAMQNYCFSPNACKKCILHPYSIQSYKKYISRSTAFDIKGGTFLFLCQEVRFDV